jgi:4-hydroxy-tetrahydrodipicolinate reductase
MPMDVVICGYGKMGTLIERVLTEKGHSVAAVIDTSTSVSKSGAPVFKSIKLAFETNGTLIKKADVAIDFTHPSVVLENIKNFAEKQIPLVVGTTGWYNNLDDVKKIIADNKASLLYAPNFSIGVNLFYNIIKNAAILFNKFEDYDIGILESHHNKKADSPSGTAKIIANILLKNSVRKTKVIDGKLDRPTEKNEIHLSSLRVGSTPGTHSVYFDSIADTIEITHTARNREGLVLGAITAAEWLVDAVKSGKQNIYTLEDIL